MPSPRVLAPLAVALGIGAFAPVALAQPADDAPVVNVALGDSFMSGEAGRWRGNVDDAARFTRADAGGPHAYWDTATGESTPGCHRSAGAEVRFPGAVGVNLACSGATVFSRWDGTAYKPGIDDGAPDPATGAAMPGQLTLLAQVARRARVGTVLMSVGGNELGFGAIVRGCLGNFTRRGPLTRDCASTPAMRARFSDAAIAHAGDAVEAAIIRVHAAMQAAGYPNGTWNMIVQDYPRPVAVANRYPDTLRARLYDGGCPFHDADIRWINGRLPRLAVAIGTAALRAGQATGQPVRFLSITNAFAGRELCARGARRVDHLAPGQVIAQAERVSMVRVFAPFSAQESVHPNQLGQQALQACLRAAWNGGDARSGRCDAPADWAKMDADGLPLMRFTPAP